MGVGHYLSQKGNMKKSQVPAPQPPDRMSEFDRILEEAAEIRGELNDVLWKRYKRLQKFYAEAFDVSPSILKKQNDLVYYQGGYPAPKSPPKSESVAVRFAEAFQLLWLLGREDDLQIHLRKMGLEVRILDKSKMRIPLKSKRAPEDLQKFAKKHGLTLPRKWEEESVREFFIETCCVLQKEICQKANVIKKELFPEAKRGLKSLRSSDFRETVGLRYRASRISEKLHDPMAVAPTKRVRQLQEKVEDSLRSAKVLFHGVKTAMRPLDGKAEEPRSLLAEDHER